MEAAGRTDPPDLRALATSSRWDLAVQALFKRLPRPLTAAWSPAKTHPVGGIDELLPGHLDTEAGSLTGVLESYPHACLRDVDTLDGGMPPGVVTQSVLWVLGDSSNTSANSWYIQALAVGDVRFEAP
jgi:hypothetical protein